MKRKSIVIGTPTFGLTSLRWSAAYRTLAIPMNSRCFLNIKQGMEVGDARNAIVAETLAMNPVPSHVFFLDDDVIPPTPFPLRQLIKDDLPIVSGVYFTKNEFSEPVALMDPGCGTFEYVPGTGVHRVFVPCMGLCLIQTHVFEKVRDNCDIGVDKNGNPRWFFTRGDEPGEDEHTEDAWFTMHARAQSFESHVDTSPYTFAWHFDNDIQAGFPRSQWDEYLKTNSVSWEVSNDVMERVAQDPIVYVKNTTMAEPIITSPGQVTSEAMLALYKKQMHQAGRM